MGFPWAAGNPLDPNVNNRIDVKSATLLEPGDLEGRSLVDLLFDRALPSPPSAIRPNIGVKAVPLSTSAWGTVAFEDVNGDMKPDLVHADGFRILVHLNRGEPGDFDFESEGRLLASRSVTTPIDPAKALPSPHFESHITFGDVDNDGDRDLICGERWHGNVLVFLMQNGEIVPGVIREFGPQLVLQAPAVSGGPRTNIALGASDTNSSYYAPDAYVTADEPFVAPALVRWDQDDKDDLLVMVSDTDVRSGAIAYVYRFLGVDSQNGNAPVYDAPIEAELGYSFLDDLTGRVVPTIANIDETYGTDVLVSTENGFVYAFGDSGDWLTGGGRIFNSGFSVRGPANSVSEELGTMVLPQDIDGDEDLDWVLLDNASPFFSQQTIRVCQGSPLLPLADLRKVSQVVTVRDVSTRFTTSEAESSTNLQVTDLNGDLKPDLIKTSSSGYISVAFSTDTGNDFDPTFASWVPCRTSDGQLFNIRLELAGSGSEHLADFRISLFDSNSDGAAEGFLMTLGNNVRYSGCLGVGLDGYPVLSHVQQVSLHPGLTNGNSRISISLADFSPSNSSPAPDGAFVIRRNPGDVVWVPISMYAVPPNIFGSGESPVVVMTDGELNASDYHQPIARDVDRDGDVDLIVVSHSVTDGASSVSWYLNTAGEGQVPTLDSGGSFKSLDDQILSFRSGGLEAFSIVDHPRVGFPLIFSRLAIGSTNDPDASPWEITVSELRALNSSKDVYLAPYSRGRHVGINQTLSTKVEQNGTNRLAVTFPFGISESHKLAINWMMTSLGPASFAEKGIVGPDADGDGLPYEWEVANGFDPNRSDTDGDGIPDGSEDIDGDNLDNNWEVKYFENITSYTGISDVEPDGAMNATEYYQGTNPLKKDHPAVGLIITRSAAN